MTYWASEEGLVYRSDLWSVARPIAVVMERKRETRLTVVQAVGAVGVVDRGAGAGVLRNNG